MLNITKPMEVVKGDYLCVERVCPVTGYIVFANGSRVVAAFNDTYEVFTSEGCVATPYTASNFSLTLRNVAPKRVKVERGGWFNHYKEHSEGPWKTVEAARSYAKARYSSSYSYAPLGEPQYHDLSFYIEETE